MSDVRIEDVFVDVPGGSVFVRKWTADKSDNSPVVLLHDSLGSVELWRDFPGTLAQRLSRPVIAYDRLGFGRSSARQGLPSTDFIAEEARIYFPAIISALGLAKFSLFGHSVGGAMALVIAATQVSGCQWVASESAQAFVEPRTLTGILAAKEQFGRPEQLNRLMKWHGDKAQWVLDAWTQTWLSPAFASWSLDPYLGHIRCPVLAIHGDLDEYGSVEFPNRIVSGVQGASQLAILRECGHVPHREQQDQVLELVSGFAASMESGHPDTLAPDNSNKPKPLRGTA
ncbi:alpha/beta fold hydrolase [Lysobacter cavernae]|uniref:Alpha/beta fold hydrolase n=1 Tax=Lysobacter cavernae TaxID=1685901 RepID=A0ABV7RMJ9_9GAMM